MATSGPKKVYGLILKGARTDTRTHTHTQNASGSSTHVAGAAGARRTAAAFGDDAADDDGGGVEDTRAALARVQAAKRAEAEAAAAAAQEETQMYEADYDEWKAREEAQKAQQRREASAIAVRAPKESRYISSLLAVAEERKFAREMAFERQQARQREAEEAEFGKTEEFVTSAYKAKLEERRVREEEEARKAAEEEKHPLQRNAGAFFRSMLQARLGTHAGDVVPEAQNSQAAPSSTSAARASADQTGKSGVGARPEPGTAPGAPAAAGSVRLRGDRSDEDGGSDDAAEMTRKRRRDEALSANARRVESAQDDVGVERDVADAGESAAAHSPAAKPPRKRYAPGERRTSEAEIAATRERALQRLRGKCVDNPRRE